MPDHSMSRGVTLFRMGRGPLLCVLTLVACAHNSPQPAAELPASEPEYTPARDPLIGPAWVQATGAYIVERCNRHSGSDVPTDGDPPSVHVVDAGGVEVKQACGLVAYEVYAPAYLLRFSREVCGIADNAPMTDACGKRFTDMFIARLSERYASANWSAVSQHCTAYPLDCDTPVAIERNLLASHNAGIQAWYAGAVAYAQARQEAQYEQEREAQARMAEQRRNDRRRFWQGVGNALSAMGPPPSIQCTSNTWGTTTTTNCH
jgi:hypothetical protein